ncbi:MAG: hypothetical protein AABY03_00755 [Nanoarchaeota archaeon]
MNKKFLFAFLIALLAIPFAFAADTTLTIQTLPEHDVDISILRPTGIYSLIESFHKKSDSNGTVSITFSTTETEYYARVWLKKDNVIIEYLKFEEGYTVGEAKTFEVYPEWYLKQKEIENSGNFDDGDSETPTETTETSTETEAVSEETSAATETPETKEVEETTTSDGNSSFLSQITGFTFFKEGNSSNIIYYVVGGIALLTILGTTGFVVMKRRGFNFRSRMNGGDEQPKGRRIRVVKLSDRIREGKQKQEQENKEDDEIAQAEAKLKELQEHIQDLKNKPQMSEKEKKIAAAKKKLMEDEKKLMKLREEKDDSDSENSNDDSDEKEEN